MCAAALHGDRNHTQKTPRPICWGVLLCVLWCVAGIGYADDECGLDPQTHVEPATLKAVIDGDTIELSDERHVRVIGVNAPEVAHENKTAEPLGDKARDYTQKFFQDNLQIKLKIGTQDKDNYGRTLAVVYNAHGENLAAQLLRKGLGAQIIFPPNVDDMDCLHTQEQLARRRQRGIWDHPYFQPRPANNLSMDDAGFRFVEGTVTDVRISSSAWWMTLDEELQVKVNKLAWPYMQVHDIEAMRGKKIIVRGWIVDLSQNSQPITEGKRWLVSVHHPLMLEVEK